MKSSTVIGGASEKFERHNSDFYSTPRECTVALMDFLSENMYGLLNPRILVVEPACGDGAISAVLKEYYISVTSSDVRDTCYTDSVCDFLSTTNIEGRIIITNPPFNLSEKFIKKCIDLDLMMFALLLKGQYWHSKTRLELFNSQKPSFILPLTWRPVFVAERGKSPTMEFMWVVWTKYDQITKYIPLPKPSSICKNKLF